MRETWDDENDAEYGTCARCGTAYTPVVLEGIVVGAGCEECISIVAYGTEHAQKCQYEEWDVNNLCGLFAFLPVRVAKALDNAWDKNLITPYTVEHIEELPDSFFLSLPNFGKVSLRQLHEGIAQYKKHIGDKNEQ